MIGPQFAAAVGARTIKRIAAIIGIVALVVAIVAGAIGYEVAVWRECLKDHPWWYCLATIQR